MLTVITLALLCAGAYVFVYNGIATAMTKVDQGWSGIEVQLKRRHDLAPQLVNAVRSAIRHDQSMLDRVLEARTKAIGALAGHDPESVAAAEAELSRALTRLLGYAEDTPEITATANIERFQRQIEESEDQIAAARRLYNGNVQNLNGRLVSFPGLLLVPVHGFRQAKPFALAQSERDAAYAVPEHQL